MKITRNTPDQLIIENNPIWLAVFVSAFAMVFVAIGLFNIGAEPVMGFAFIGGGLFFGILFNLAFIRRTQLILDGPRNLVELRRRGWLNYVSMTWELRYLDRAIVESSNSGDSTTYRAAFVINGGMDAGTHPVTLVYSSGRGAKRAKDAINAWLDSRTTAS
ncbi:hypothetical protein OS190_03485 [Sulfitobacter sp. F26204]|uniref:hypothetical protein n=1 Tax=Sulfitobacter sp. F26204 TaxID=2996014 RepID=UPI00225DDBFD|nr:hypothetical protein [Sulfitobacter sp. F26204]MCX7558614.1 hypothetical protein [Sulfitobacter sp. F26204]